ncbi:MAG: type II secretion system protein [Candidatus Azambacteria bacterium]|nr:type II secretion system protein [Candidatus Azambacteria bacterium]
MRIPEITNKEKGLTLIELMVATGIFGLVISVVFGIFILATINQRRIIALRNVGDNVRFTMESMAREIRTGKNFGGSINSLSFTNARDESVIYRLNNQIIEKSSNGGSSYFSVVGPEVTVDYLNFYLIGQTAGDGLQPRVTITTGVTSKVGNQSVNSKIQTTISERLIQS